MANDKAFKVKNGLQAGRYLQSAGTETMGVEGYSLSNAVYDGVSFNVATQETSPRDVSFKPDGTKMYIIGQNSDSINEYSLSTAWDVSTASHVTVFSFSGQSLGQPTMVDFKSDGTKMFVLDTTQKAIFQYSLSTSWDVSTASYDSKSFNVSTQDASPFGLFVKPDGSKMYVLGTTNDVILEYDLSTSWDVSTASYVQNFSVASQDTAANGVFFAPDGTSMFVGGTNSGSVLEYNLITAWDVSTASYSGTSFPVSSQELVPSGLTFSSDGSKMYITGSISDSVFQYTTASYTQALDLSTGTYFSFTPSGNTDISFSNPPQAGLAQGFAVEINGTGAAITWPSSVKWDGAAAPTATASKEVYVFVTTDGGVTYYGKQSGSDIA